MHKRITDPLLLTIPEGFESKRLLIRAPQYGDGTALNEAIRDSIAELQAWLPQAQTIPTPEESELNIRRARLKFLERTDLRLLLFLQETDQLVGSSGLHRMDGQARSFEIGYWVRTPFSGQGLITEAVEAITRFAVQQLQANRIEIRCDSRNVRSAQVAKRAGFTLEGELRNERCDTEGEPRNTLVFAKVRGTEF